MRDAGASAPRAVRAPPRARFAMGIGHLCQIKFWANAFMKGVVKRVAKILVRSPPVRHVAARLHMAPWQFVPPGHFYSPIPALDGVRRDEQRIFPHVIP